MNNKKILFVFLINLFGITFSNLISNTESISNSLENAQEELDYDDEDHKPNLKYKVEPRDKSWKNPNLPYWSKVKYAGDKQLPDAIQRPSGSFPMFFFEFDEDNNLMDKESKTLLRDIYLHNPKNIDFYRELNNVKTILQKVKDGDIQNCYNFDAYPNIELFDSLNILIDSYQLTGPQRIRLHGFFNSALNDAMVIAWFYKFFYEIPRPNQLDQKLKTLLCTPYHPSYPSGHAVIGSTGIELLSNMFPEEKEQMDNLFSSLKKARLYSGVHFDADNHYGEILGRKIGRYVFRKMHSQKDENGRTIDVFNQPIKKPFLKVQKRKNSGIMTCNSLIDGRSINYLNRLNN